LNATGFEEPKLRLLPLREKKTHTHTHTHTKGDFQHELQRMMNNNLKINQKLLKKCDLAIIKN
jgi:hypothetical protein